MAGYEVLFYETADRRCPAQDFLDELPLTVRAKVAKWIDLLRREGPDLPRPYSDVVQGKIRELRVSFGGMRHRLLYFFYGKHIVVTHGFVKKTAAVPQQELTRSRRYMEDFLSRMERGAIHL